MGKFIEDRFEAEFVVEQSQDEVWAALQEQNDVEAAWLSAWPRMPGFDTTGEVIEVQAPRLVRVAKHSEPCKGSEIAISLESVDNGTRVLVVQSGFPAWVKESLESFEIGGNHIVADLILFLERGVTVSRHSMPWAFAGFTTQEVGAGLEVMNVMPGMFGERLGLEPGDLLVTLGGAPVFKQTDLQTLMRAIAPGNDTAATWVRGRELLEGSALL